MKSGVITCFECDSGVYDIVCQDFETVVNVNGNVETILVPNTKQFVCNKCGDVCIDSDGSDNIEEFRKEYIKKIMKEKDENV